MPSTADGEVQLAYGGGGTITIDAIRTYPSLQRVWKPLPTLAALAGPASSVQPGLWGSIRTGDVLGNGRDQVLALDGKGLQIYSYDSGSNAWSEAQPSMPLTLTNEWMTNPAYYSTIRVGDVDGDGRADVVVRGPYGIRTFFYNRRGTGGWESYLPGGYPRLPEPAVSLGGHRAVRPAGGVPGPQHSGADSRRDHDGTHPRRVDHEHA